MWNFSYTVPSLLVLIMIMGYFFALPRIPIRLTRAFIKLVCIETAVLVTDIWSTWACINYAALPSAVVYLSNDLYFIFFFLRAYAYFLFTACVLRTSFSYATEKKILALIPVIALSLVVISSFRTHMFFYIDETGYHSGAMYMLLYVLSSAYLLISLIMIVKHRLRVRRKRELNSVVWYNIILVIGLIFRYSFPKYLLMDAFCIIAIIIIYLSFENPDFYLESRTWIFNSIALRDLVEEINNQKKYTVLEFVVHNYRDLRELYGSRQMDQGICLIGDYLRKIFKNEKVFYYRSGRFLIMGEHDFDYENAYDMIRERFKDSWKSDDAELYLDTGAAVIHFGEQNIRLETVMNIISDGFEKAAHNGNDEIVVFGREMLETSAKLGDVKRALKYAIERDTVKVYLQPIISSQTGKVDGAEALTRIIDKDNKLIPPDLFIPIAEKNGMINQLGDMVFEKTCQFIKEHDVVQNGLSWINVNLSPIQFLRNDIADRLYDCAKKYDVDPSFIHLEITEEALIDATILAKQMEAIISKGFLFVLDDYGKGYSNFIRVKRCPFINIKLDMSLVRDHYQNPDGLLPNMVSSFRKLGFKMTAEGVEDEEMAKVMTEVGVDYLQGYCFSKPIPMEDFVEKYFVR